MYLPLVLTIAGAQQFPFTKVGEKVASVAYKGTKVVNRPHETFIMRGSEEFK